MDSLLKKIGRTDFILNDLWNITYFYIYFSDGLKSYDTLQNQPMKNEKFSDRFSFYLSFGTNDLIGIFL